MKDYVKAEDAAFALQMKNFSDKLPAHAALLGISAGTLTAVSNDADFFVFALAAIDTADSYKQGWTQMKIKARKGTEATVLSSFPTPVDVTSPPTAVLPGVEDRFRKLVQQIKANPNYSTVIGEDLGIVAPEDTSVLTAPVLTVKLDGGVPVIGFKKGKSGGIRLYSKRGSEADFSFLAVDTKSPYRDTRPNLGAGPEQRQYYAYFIVDDQQTGDPSTVVSITVG